VPCAERMSLSGPRSAFWTRLFEAGVCMRRASPGSLPCVVPGVLAECHRTRATVKALRLLASGCQMRCI